MKTIGIIGSRRRNSKEDKLSVIKAFEDIYEYGDQIVSGGCPSGGDYFAEFIAFKYQVPIMIWYAQWDRFGRSAGFKRNTFIAADADILIACVAPDRTGGTEDTIQKYLKLGKTKLILV